MKFHGSLSIALSLCLAATASTLAADAKKKAAPPAPADTPAAAPAPAGKPFVLPETVAVVEGAEIKKAELEKAFSNVLAAQKMTPAGIPMTSGCRATASCSTTSSSTNCS